MSNMSKQMKILAEDPTGFNPVLDALQQIFATASSGAVKIHVDLGRYTDEEIYHILEFLMIQGFDYKLEKNFLYIGWEDPGEW